MIYKLIDGRGYELEVEQTDIQELTLTINEGDESSYFYLDKDNLYNLIGALHSLQSKMKRGGHNE